ncbi:MAG: PIN domain-containing protein [Candidatus Bathyarchaeia archaeon]
MSSKYVIDSYAWIEYFRASKSGEIAKKYIESQDSTTPTIVVSEISRKLTKEIELGNETPQGRTERLEFIRAKSQIVNLDFEMAIEAGKIDVEMKKKEKSWGLADSIVLCLARSKKGKVVTGDLHFKELDNVIFIKE